MKSASLLQVKAERIADDRLAPAVWSPHFTTCFDDCPPGERSDTLHVGGLPKRWFCPRGAKTTNAELLATVSQHFGAFGPVGEVALALPPAGDREAAAVFCLTFAVHVQYKTFEGFCRACASLRNRKLVRVASCESLILLSQLTPLPPPPSPPPQTNKQTNNNNKQPPRPIVFKQLSNCVLDRYPCLAFFICVFTSCFSSL